LANEQKDRCNREGPRGGLEPPIKIILEQDQAAAQVVREAFNLSESEEKFIFNAEAGQGILVTPEGRIPFYNYLSDAERRLFTTRPRDVTA